MKIVLFVLLILISFSCSNSERKTEQFELYESRSNATVKKIKIDTILIDHPNTSYVGFYKFGGDSLYFFDKFFCTVATINKEGKIENINLGKGDGPKEIPDFQTYTYINGKHMLFNNYDFITYDKYWNKISTQTLDWNPETSFKIMRNDPKPYYRGIYEIKYFDNDFGLLSDSVLVFNIESTHPKFNGYFSDKSKKYYETAKTFAKLNTNSGIVENLYGQYPDYYVQNNNLPIFANAHKYISDKKIFVNFEADYKIYVYSENFEPLYSFGIKPDNIRENYTQTTSYDQTEGLWQEEHETKGYYKNIYYDSTADVYYRCYLTGVKTNSEKNVCRMQIYKKKDLIGDVVVPTDFRIIGSDDKFIYADGCYDERNQKIGYYRFSKNSIY